MAAADPIGEAVMRRLGPIPAVFVAAAVATAVATLAALAPGSPVASSCAGAGSHRAALVVEHGDGSVVTRCVSFDTAAVTGEGLLNSSGVAWSGQGYGGFGDAVCALDAEPEHYSTCPGKDNYWAVFVSRSGGGWQLASVGISSLTLNDGDAEGFRYVPAVGSPEPPPAPVGVCPAAATAGTSAGAADTAGATSSAGASVGVAATPRSGGTAGATGSGGLAVAAATNDYVGASAATPAVAAAAAGASSGPGATSRPGATSAPGSGSGVDPGLLIAALVGGGLAGLAGLRLTVLRRRGA